MIDKLEERIRKHIKLFGTPPDGIVITEFEARMLWIECESMPGGARYPMEEWMDKKYAGYFMGVPVQIGEIVVV
jgi:hypothetical protein